MPRRSGRVASAAAAMASDPANDGENVDTPLENVLKGAEITKGGGDTKDATNKKTSSKMKTPAKKGATTKKRKANVAASEENKKSGSKSEAKSKSTAKKRKGKGDAMQATDGDHNGEIQSAKSQKSPAPKKRKAKAADHQRWTERTPINRLWDPREAAASRGSYSFTVISWNVAGLRAFVKKRPDALSDLASRYGADVICLQETKLQDGHLDDPKLKLREYFEEKLGGYDSHWSYSLEKKGYSGTAMFIKKRRSECGDSEKNANEGGSSKKGKKQATLGAFFVASKSGGNDVADAGSAKEGDGDKQMGDIPISHLIPIKVDTDLGLPAHDGEGRAITAEFPLFYLTNVYVPNSGQNLVRLGYRTERWDADFLSKMQELETEGKKPVVWLGDLNVAHDEKDTWNEGAKHLAKSAGTTPEERASFARQLGAGYVDAFRALHPEGRGHYTYWSQRAGNREPNKGLRLDYFVCSEKLMQDDGVERVRVRDSYMVPDELGSDHCPIVLEIEIEK